MNLTELCDDIQRIHCCGLIGDDITSTNVCDKIGMRGILQHRQLSQEVIIQSLVFADLFLYRNIITKIFP
jgi:hypothetical protein